MKKVLIVDDSKTILLGLKELCEKDYGLEVDIASSMSEAAKLVLKNKGEYALALLDYSLPDAPNGEIVDFIDKFDIKSILLTGRKLNKNNKVFKNFFLIDYVIKNGSYALDYVSYLLHTLLTNHDKEVLIVDNSKTFCKKVEELCQKYNLKTIVKSNGKDALKLLEEAHHNIKLVLSGYHMVDMNGIEFLSKIRQTYKKDQLAFIALSGTYNQTIISDFLRFGANDFLHKDFSDEAFFARITNSLELLRHIEEAKDKAIKDYMTNLYNRRYLFEFGLKKYEKAKKEKSTFVLAVLDVDNFKDINDKYGHDIGDIAIKAIPKVLYEVLGSNALIFRLGGEEFAIVLRDIKEEDILPTFENIRQKFEENKVFYEEEKSLHYTVSIGVTTKFGKDLDHMLRTADVNLYQAKRSGRNRVVFKG